MWSKYQTSILVAISIIILFSMFWFLQSLAMVIFVSLLLTIFLNSTVDKLTSRKVPRILAAAGVLGGFIAVICFFFAMLSGTFLPTFANFVADIPEIADNLKNLSILQTNPFIGEQLDDVLKSFTASGMTALKSSLGILLGVFSKFLNLIIIFFITFYLLKDGKEIKKYLANLFPTKDKTRILVLFNNIIGALSAYLRGQLTVCLLTGIFVFAYFTMQDLPYASVFAVLSALGEFIPVVGPTVASLCGTLLAFTETPVLGTQTLLFYIVLTQVNHNIVYPYLIGKTLNLHPVAIMLGILLGGETLGPLGMFLAVPCMVIIKLVIEDIFHYRMNSMKN